MKRKTKVKLYLSSGQTMIVKFDEFSMSRLSGTKGNRTMSCKGGDRKFTIDLDEIVAVEMKKVLF